MLQADSVGRVLRLKLIVRDFFDLQPQEVITILAILFRKSRSRLSKKSVVFKADGAQKKQATFLPKRELA